MFRFFRKDLDEVVNDTLEKEKPKKLIDIKDFDEKISEGSPFTEDFKVWLTFYLFNFYMFIHLYLILYRIIFK